MRLGTSILESIKKYAPKPQDGFLELQGPVRMVFCFCPTEVLRRGKDRSDLQGTQSGKVLGRPGKVVVMSDESPSESSCAADVLEAYVASPS